MSTEIATHQVIVPHTGEVLSLDSPPEELAALLTEVKEVESRLRELKGEVSVEIHRRMDMARKWTMAAGDYVLAGKSDALVTEYDPDLLAVVLTQLVDEGAITPDAMDEALESVSTWKVRKAGINALRKSAKFAELIDACGTEKEPEGRRVTVRRKG
jgi:hypothetical protein